MRIKPILWGSMALAFAGVGCAHKNEVAPVPSPTAQPAATPVPDAAAPTPPPDRQPVLQYDVRKGDSLWSIAAKPGVLGDPFQWPLLFKQNRDQITDPDLIATRQQLNYGAPADSAAVKVAIEEAKDTPAYSRHREARKHLPMNY